MRIYVNPEAKKAMSTKQSGNKAIEQSQEFRVPTFRRCEVDYAQGNIVLRLGQTSQADHRMSRLERCRCIVVDASKRRAE